MEVPSELAESLAAGWAGPQGGEWLEALPSVIEAAQQRWDITIGPPYEPGGYTSFVAPATRRDGTTAVYKCTIPHDEAIGEGAALAAYSGEGSVRLLASKPDTFELLVERCVPGTSLWAIPSDDERLDIACDLLRRLWRPSDAGAVRPLDAVARRWSAITQERLERFGCPWEAEPVERAIELFDTLPRDPTHEVLIHGDFHHGNILSAGRLPWLAIDPKPMIGDPAYEPTQLLTQRNGRLAPPPTRDEAERRLVSICERLGLEPRRVALWSVARTAEWSMWSIAHDAPADARVAHQWAALLHRIAPA